MPLFLLLLAVPLAEIALFVQVGGAIGLWPTLGLVLATAVAGAALLRREGRAAFDRLQSALARGGDVAAPLGAGAAIMAGGLLLLTPGFLTDALGLALLVPVTRTWLWRLLQRVAGARVVTMRAHGPATEGAERGATIEGDYTVLEPENEDAGRAR